MHLKSSMVWQENPLLARSWSCIMMVMIRRCRLPTCPGHPWRMRSQLLHRRHSWMLVTHTLQHVAADRHTPDSGKSAERPWVMRGLLKAIKAHELDRVG